MVPQLPDTIVEQTAKAWGPGEAAPFDTNEDMLMGDVDYSTVLWHEFNAEEGSFLLQLRCDFVWDRAAFTRLTEAMLACCQAYDEDKQQSTVLRQVSDPMYVPRWLADGFWYVATYVEGHTAHPAWKEKIAADPSYYNRAYERLRDLADWFFSGHCGYLDPIKQFAPM